MFSFSYIPFSFLTISDDRKSASFDVCDTPGRAIIDLDLCTIDELIEYGCDLNDYLMEWFWDAHLRISCQPLMDGGEAHNQNCGCRALTAALEPTQPYQSGGTMQS